MAFNYGMYVYESDIFRDVCVELNQTDMCKLTPK